MVQQRKYLPDEIWVVIFSRLPDCATTIRCSSVCKRWRNLIRGSRFIHRFGSGLPQLYTHLIGFWGSDKYSEFNTFNTSYDQTPSDFSETCLDFLPWPAEDVKIRASFDDLLLVSQKINENHLYVCNVFTKQCITLPQAPMQMEAAMWGLVCTKEPGCSCNVKYKVVLISFPFMTRTDRIQELPLPMAIFCSETGRWKESAIQVWECGETPRECRVLSMNNAMHWLTHSFVLTYSPFRSSTRCRSIHLPSIFFEIPGRSGLLGHLKGQLRLLMFPNQSCKSRCALVWELKDSYDYDGDEEHEPRPFQEESWNLVHSVEVAKPEGEHVLVLGLHPEDGDLVFVLRNCRNVCIYNLVEGVFREVCPIGCAFERFAKRKDSDRVMSMEECGFFTLAHPSQPSLLPQLSQSSITL